MAALDVEVLAVGVEIEAVVGFAVVVIKTVVVAETVVVVEIVVVVAK